MIFINQIRMKIGVMFGNPETTTGGNALKFYASVRLDIRRIGAIKKGDEVVGNETRVKVVKNKVAPPFREALFDILYGEGISRDGEIIELGVAHGIIEKSGAWYAYNGEKIGQGKDNTREFLREHPEMADEIEAKIRAAVGVPVARRAAGARRAAASATNSACIAVTHRRAIGLRRRRVAPEPSATLQAPRGRGCSREPRILARASRARAREYSRASAASSSAPTAPTSPRSTRVLDELAALGYLSDARFAQARSSRQKSGALQQARDRRERSRRSGVDGEAAARRRSRRVEIDDRRRAWSRCGGADSAAPPADDSEKARQVALSAKPRLLAVGDLQAAARCRRTASAASERRARCRGFDAGAACRICGAHQRTQTGVRAQPREISGDALQRGAAVVARPAARAASGKSPPP